MLYVLFLAIPVVIIVVQIVKLVKKIKEKQRQKWNDKIGRALSGDLGSKLKSHIYSRSEVYRVYDHAISFYDANGNETVIPFARFGYANIPVEYTDIICNWLKRNVVSNGSAYCMEPMVHNYERKTGGTSDSYEIRSTFMGVKVSKIPGSSGTWEESKIMLGHMLYHHTKAYRYSSSQQLQSW